jgi:hypothetical protein
MYHDHDQKASRQVDLAMKRIIIIPNITGKNTMSSKRRFP